MKAFHPFCMEAQSVLCHGLRKSLCAWWTITLPFEVLSRA